jgi:hypothetical protein
MARFVSGEIVVVPFPFTDLQSAKVRRTQIRFCSLSSTSVWRSGGWSDACGFMGSMREFVRGNLSPRRGGREHAVKI